MCSRVESGRFQLYNQIWIQVRFQHWNVCCSVFLLTDNLKTKSKVNYLLKFRWKIYNNENLPPARIPVTRLEVLKAAYACHNFCFVLKKLKLSFLFYFLVFVLDRAKFNFFYFPVVTEIFPLHSFILII